MLVTQTRCLSVTSIILCSVVFALSVHWLRKTRSIKVFARDTPVDMSLNPLAEPAILENASTLVVLPSNSLPTSWPAHHLPLIQSTTLPLQTKLPFDMAKIRNLGVVFCGKDVEFSGAGDWFYEELVKLGAVKLDIDGPPLPKGPLNAKPYGEFKVDQVEKVFDACSTCSHFLFTISCDKIYTTAIRIRGTKGGVITSGSSRATGCSGLPNWRGHMEKNPMAVPSTVELLIVDSARHRALCPKAQDRMLNLGLFYIGFCAVSLQDLGRRRSEMEQRWQTYPGEKFVLAIGSNRRDYETLLQATAPLKLKVRILANGQKPPSCTASRHCEAMGFVSNKEYADLHLNALFIAMPLVRDSNRFSNGHGITALQSAVAIGKIVVLTDTGGHIHDDLIWNGTSGFVIKARSVTD